MSMTGRLEENALPTAKRFEHRATRLLVFTRIPRPGRAKTRLIPALGARGAAALQQDMTRRMLEAARQWELAGPCSTELHIADGTVDEGKEQFGRSWRITPQGSGDLGDRLARAFRSAFDHGNDRVVAVGTDIPRLDARHLLDATAALQHADVVIGPARDGGYYLIGMNRFHPRLFEGISWGSEHVFAQTVQRLEEHGLPWCELPMLCDVDRPEDLDDWHRLMEEEASARRRPGIAVVIPALDEADQIADTIESAREGDPAELIVVDGGSRDGTAEVAAEHGADVWITAPGRARQLNVGLAACRAEIVLMLHADTRLPSGYGDMVCQAMAEDRHVAGAFRLRFDISSVSLRLIAWGANRRSTWWQLPYGDQAIFSKRKTLVDIGGMRDVPMEDYHLMRDLRRRGRIALLPSAVTTSARKYLEHGPWRTVWHHQKMLLHHRGD